MLLTCIAFVDDRLAPPSTPSSSLPGFYDEQFQDSEEEKDENDVKEIVDYKVDRKILNIC